MVAIGLILLWVSYSLIWYGYSRIYSVNVSAMDIIVPGRYDLCRWHDDWIKAKDIKASGGCKPEPSTTAPPETLPGVPAPKLA